MYKCANTCSKLIDSIEHSCMQSLINTAPCSHFITCELAIKTTVVAGTKAMCTRLMLFLPLDNLHSPASRSFYYEL